MAQLTDTSDWNYTRYAPPPLSHFDALARSTDGWIGVARRFMPDTGDFIELGCAPGYCSAAMTYQKQVRPHGIDFSASADSYLATMAHVGHPGATLIKGDLLQYQPTRQFDVVGSFGLIEHFSNDDLARILALHDRLLAPGGTLIIELPNFNGFQNLWHRWFDNPSYRLHNIATMTPDTFRVFSPADYDVLFCDYVGTLEVWGDSGGYTAAKPIRKIVRKLDKLVNRVSRGLKRIGLPLKGRNFAPALLFVAVKKPNVRPAP